MAQFDREMAIRLILGGQPAQLAVLLAHGMQFREEVVTRWMVKTTGSLGATPSPDCVAKHLSERPTPPSRADIEWALDKCSA